MSQLFSTFGVQWHLLAIQLVNFALLLGALWYFLYRPVLRIIDERRAKIAESVRTAQAADHRLQEAKEESDRMVGEAARQAEDLVSSARLRADERASEIVKDAQDRAARLSQDAEEKALEAKRRAIAESEREIARAAMLAAEKILNQKAA